MRTFILSFCFFYSSLLSASHIAVVTIAAGDEYQALVRLGTESKKKYCEQHGYDFIFIEESTDPTRRIYWSKILALLKALENPSYEWVVWMDADTLIMNQGIRLEELIDEQYNMMIAEDFQGINAGVFFLRNCEWSSQFLNTVYGRTDCLNEWLNEQTAMVRVLEDRTYGKRTKIVPQRLFNSYAAEMAPYSRKVTYQPGDFILHFASARGQQLHSLFQKYSAKALNDSSLITFKFHLGFYGLSPSSNNSLFMSDEQRQTIVKRLKKLPHIESVAEISLNGGHNAETFFTSCLNLKKFTIFNANNHLYATAAADYFRKVHKTAFEFVPGNSRVSVPTYASNNPNQLFDLIWIDGEHSYNECRADLLNCKKLAHPETVVLIDDYTSAVYEVVQELQNSGVLKVKQVFTTKGPQGDKCWIEACYR
jgi:hypothetical protein